MTIQQIRRTYDRTPFRPFVIRTASGGSFTVPHREFMWIHPTEPTIAVADPAGGMNVIDAELVTELILETRRTKQEPKS